MKLFDVNKVGVFCDAIQHLNEKRKSGDAKVISLTLRVDPFDVKLALALSAPVRNTIFKLNHPDPQPHIRRCDFALGVERQLMTVFASSDTVKASIAFDHVKISGIYVRTKKDANGYTLVFKATFGPVGDKELAYCEAWRLGQRSVSFDAAEPNLEYDDEESDDEDDDAADDTPARPPLEFETTGEGAPLQASADDQEPARQMPRRHTRKTH